MLGQNDQNIGEDFSPLPITDIIWNVCSVWNQWLIN
jgi:hypothetical protein